MNLSSSFLCSVSGIGLPFLSSFVHLFRIASGEPFTKLILCICLFSLTVLISFLSEVNGNSLRRIHFFSKFSFVMFAFSAVVRRAASVGSPRN